MPKAPKVQLTPEEKKELKAQKKLQKKLQLIEKKKQLKRDYLGREVKYGDLTIKRHEKEWRQMLINIALPKMREDLEFAWHNFERVVDCKDFTISLLMDEVRDAEEQYMMNVMNHIEHIDQLIDLFHVQLEELEADNEAELARLQKESEAEAEEIILTAAEEENYLKTIVFILEIARKQQKQNVRAEYFSKLDEEATKNIDILHRLRALLERNMQDVWKSTGKFLKDYRQQTKERKRDNKELKTQDDALQTLLIDQLDKIRKSYDYIKIFKQKFCDSQKLLGSMLNDVEAKYDFFAFAYNTLKIKLVGDRENDYNQIRTLTVSYNNTVEDLVKLKEKGERILHVAAICRKLETQAEKISPFPININDDVSVDMSYECQYIQSMDLFWQRVAQVDASKHSVYEEREFLRTENNILKLRLHQYCQCITCPAKQTITNSKVRYITEGVFEQQKYAKQNFKQFTSKAHNDNLDY